MKKKIILLMLSIILVLVILGSTTYALFFKQDKLDNVESYTSGILDIVVDNSEEGLGEVLTLASSLPLTDEEGKNSKAYKFKITNNGNITYTFDLKLLSTITNNVISSNYIKVMVNYNEPVLLSSLTDSIIESNITLNPSKSKIISVRVWLDENTPNTEIGKTFGAKLVSDGIGEERSPYIEPDITLDNYTLSWKPIENAISYDIYSNGKLLTNTTNNEIELYTYYTVPGTYDITVRTNYENDIQSTDSNNISYTIEQLMPHNYWRISTYYNDYTPEGFNEKFSNLSNSPYLRVACECMEISSFGGCSASGSEINNIYLDKRATNINVSTNRDCDSLGMTFNNDFTNNYDGVFEKFSISYNNDGVNFYYDSNLQDLVIKQHYGTYNCMSFKMYLSAPGYISSNYIYGSFNSPCLSADTEVIVYDKKRKRRRKKKIKDVTYDDLLLVWDFDKGCLAWAKPLWIKKKQTTNCYNLLKFSDGSILKTIDQHRIYNKELGKFTYPMTDDTPIGTTTFNSSGKYVTLVSKEVIYEEVDFYNVITYYHMNLFTNNILTSCRYSNLYKIKDMKYVKDNRTLHTKDEFRVDEKWFYGLRMAEQDININKDNNSYRGDTIEEHIHELEKLDINSKI